MSESKMSEQEEFEELNRARLTEKKMAIKYLQGVCDAKSIQMPMCLEFDYIIIWITGDNKGDERITYLGKFEWEFTFPKYKGVFKSRGRTIETAMYYICAEIIKKDLARPIQ